MALQQDHNYSAEDFERYYSGKMTEAEMHALEKAALEDPFVADALEGYRYAADPVKDIAELKERLSAKNKKARTFFLNPGQKRWLRIAAMFVLIAGAATTFYILNFKSDSPLLAKNESRKDSASALPQTAAMDTVRTLTDTQFATTSTTLFKSDSVKSNRGYLNVSPSKGTVNSTLSNESNVTQNNVTLQQHEEKNYSNDRAKNFKLADRNNNQPVAEGRVMDNNGNAIPAATMRDNNNRVIAKTDSAGTFRVPVYDSIANTTVSADGYKTKEITLNNKSEQKIFLDDEKKNLEEVVVTSRNMQKQRKDVGYSQSKPDVKTERALTGKVPSVTINSSQPVAGVNDFNKYVRDSIVVPSNEKGEKYQGKVVLSFHVNRKGTPEKIKVEQSLCVPCDAEAIRLLKNGPKWNFSKVRNVVEVRF